MVLEAGMGMVKQSLAPPHPVAILRIKYYLFHMKIKEKHLGHTTKGPLEVPNRNKLIKNNQCAQRTSSKRLNGKLEGEVFSIKYAVGMIF